MARALSVSLQPWRESLQRWHGRWGSALAALALVGCLLLGACSSSTSSLSGNYVDDTVAVADSLIATIALAPDDPGRSEAETRARSLINDYTARYRPRSAVNGLASFTTMQTAVNSLAGHYANYPNRPLPDALRERLTKELQKAERGVTRGA
ncbi:photosystem II protein Psb27 [Cyanobium sp. ATX 6A2]|uniref:photosystem II protein Psb27 n=1 Tax=Cyanobium sp. ATX 6A2 TaxID=2823700 RepID=UPI0020CC15B6|nr:photosystem II protein Psb27 [Cyanobium sp. ATX 6A2]MCP9887730.1 photosystem II protein Psb27 [Cyanobium sp. ATX 6A2]